MWGTETREVHLDRLRRSRGAQADLHALTVWSQNRFVAGPEFAYEALKIGGGPPPVRVPEGWLVLGMADTPIGAARIVPVRPQ